jgi:uncharacterized protein YndB with AHSA1/START domain
MRRNGLRILLITLLLLGVGMAALVYLSPYGVSENFPYKIVAHTVTIKAPAQKVFSYLGNSANAANWSVFVDHIIPLNTHQVPDGVPGSRRRCLKNSNGQGLQWDELITIVEPAKRRQLTIYNMIDFPMQADGLATEQLYRQVSPAETELTFTLFYKEHGESLLNQLKLYYAAYKVKDIYRDNMNNIKTALETIPE